MTVLRFDLLSVFAIAGRPFSGNPLAVVTGADDLDSATCLALARQFNLSESTFLADPSAPEVAADVRIFTPNVEVPFAGHPTLGSAFVAARGRGRGRVVLRMGAGDIPVVSDGADTWTLTANAGTVTESTADPADLGRMLGLRSAAVVGSAHWVNCGMEQLLLQLDSPDQVHAAVAESTLVKRLATSSSGESLAYLWAWSGPESVVARLFFNQGSAIVEDPATGSAAANLGTLLAADGQRGRRITIEQGAAVARPSRLHLQIDPAGTVRVGGLVSHLGEGSLSVP